MNARTEFGKAFDAEVDFIFNFTTGAGIAAFAVSRSDWALLTTMAAVALIFPVSSLWISNHSVFAKYRSGFFRLVLFTLIWVRLPSSDQGWSLALGLLLLVVGGLYEYRVVQHEIEHENKPMR